jgi:hypothetical protein
MPPGVGAKTPDQLLGSRFGITWLKPLTIVAKQLTPCLDYSRAKDRRTISLDMINAIETVRLFVDRDGFGQRKSRERR